MASKMIAKDAKTSLFFLRSSILVASRPKALPSHGELGQALVRISTQKPSLAEAPVLLYKEEDPSLVLGVGLGGVVGDARIWGLNNSGLEAQARRVVDDDDDDDDDHVDDDDDDDDYDIDDYDPDPYVKDVKDYHSDE